MAKVTTIGRVLVPVADQDKAIAFYTQTLGFTLTADAAFGQGSRWVEVTPPGGGPPHAPRPPPRDDHAELAGKGVDVDAEIMGGDGTVPALFFFRDHDGNTLMIVQESQG
jgi:catechol 2,3-dioxygenase-like lactoylglutathione lyase family enzyme